MSGPVEDADVQTLELVGFLVENGGFHGVEILAAVIQQDGLGRVEGDGVDQFTILPFENRRKIDDGNLQLPAVNGFFNQSARAPFRYDCDATGIQSQLVLEVTKSGHDVVRKPFEMPDRQGFLRE